MSADLPRRACADATLRCEDCQSEFRVSANERGFPHGGRESRHRLCRRCRRVQRQRGVFAAELGRVKALAARDPRILIRIADLYVALGDINKAALYLRRAKNRTPSPGDRADLLVSFRQRREWSERFRRDAERRWVLVGLRRGRWGQFIDNNVLSVLSEDVTVMWVVPRRSAFFKGSPALAIHLLFPKVERPFLIRCLSGQWEIRRLRDRLAAWSHVTRRDQSVMSEVRNVLREVMDGASLGRSA